MARSDVHPIHRFESWQGWPRRWMVIFRYLKRPAWPLINPLRLDQLDPVLPGRSSDGLFNGDTTMWRKKPNIRRQSMPAPPGKGCTTHFACARFLNIPLRTGYPTCAGGFRHNPKKFKILTAALFYMTALKLQRLILHSIGFTPDAHCCGLRCSF